MLMPTAEVMPLLRCPKTGEPLRAEASGTLTSTNGSGTTYRIHHGHPVLIDFDRSVLDAETVFDSGAASPVRRHSYLGGLRRLAKWAVSPPKRTTARNVARLREMLLERDPRPLALVVGGGSIGQGCRPLYDDPRIRLIGFDLYRSPNVQFVADAHAIPLASESVDAVIVQAVLEHVLDPHRVVAEIHRVLKPQGLVYAETPFLQQVHEGAYDFTRFTQTGHRWLFRHFEELDSGSLGGPGTQLLWTIDYLVRGLFRSRVAGKAAKLVFAWVQLLDALIPERYSVDAASGFFFLGRKADRPITPREVIRAYRGADG
ncbi:MAG: class I SAM-dependent methyltransferase [Planctomycetota bacterium]|nr:MAG: class I SAM-dependent methyltransferase [Planctomycetota bacterium]